MLAISTILLCLFFRNGSTLNKTAILRQAPWGLLVWSSVFFFSTCQADEDFSFNLDEFEKKPLEWGGYVELKWDHAKINRDSAFSQLNPADNSDSSLDQYSGTLQLDGSYTLKSSTFNWLAQASASHDDLGWHDVADVFEAYASLRPTPLATVSLGKKSYKWGKGYAWNPVGFLNRTKDPNNPEESLEGFITAEADLVKSFTGDLQTMALTTVALPVGQNINEDFGEAHNVDLAAKLYFLYKDTDIDLLFLSGNSRSERFGFDFSKNIATNFEIHGELAYVPNQKQLTLQENGSLLKKEESSLSSLLGIRYLSENDITTIIEYYHNGAGYSEDEMANFYQFIADGNAQFTTAGLEDQLNTARELSLQGYGRPQPGRDYLYARITQKDPFDILYFTPGITAIYNLGDASISLSPEVAYTGVTNWEFRLRFTYLEGDLLTEFGEKLNSSKLELRIRYFF